MRQKQAKSMSVNTAVENYKNTVAAAASECGLLAPQAEALLTAFFQRVKNDLCEGQFTKVPQFGSFTVTLARSGQRRGHYLPNPAIMVMPCFMPVPNFVRDIDMSVTPTQAMQHYGRNSKRSSRTHDLDIQNGGVHPDDLIVYNRTQLHLKRRAEKMGISVKADERTAIHEFRRKQRQAGLDCRGHYPRRRAG